MSASCAPSKTAVAMGTAAVKLVASSTTSSSDKALMSFPSLKMGPGDSARSHTADEYIYIDEIKSGIELYIQLLNQVVL